MINIKKSKKDRKASVTCYDSPTEDEVIIRRTKTKSPVPPDVPEEYIEPFVSMSLSSSSSASFPAPQVYSTSLSNAPVAQSTITPSAFNHPSETSACPTRPGTEQSVSRPPSPEEQHDNVVCSLQNVRHEESPAIAQTNSINMLRNINIRHEESPAIAQTNSNNMLRNNTQVLTAMNPPVINYNRGTTHLPEIYLNANSTQEET